MTMSWKLNNEGRKLKTIEKDNERGNKNILDNHVYIIKAYDQNLYCIVYFIIAQKQIFIVLCTLLLHKSNVLVCILLKFKFLGRQ